MRALLLALALSGCGAAGAPECSVLATRCSGDRVELCDSSGRWFVALDCADVARSSGGEWTCGETREDGEQINACLPAAEIAR